MGFPFLLFYCHNVFPVPHGLSYLVLIISNLEKPVTNFREKKCPIMPSCI